MRTTLNIEDELLKKASKLTGIKEKTSLVKLGLETLIARESSKRLAKLGGTEKKLTAVPHRRALKIKNQKAKIKNLLFPYLLPTIYRNRLEILSLLQALPMATQAEHEDVMQFIKNYRLMGKGLGYIDMHLLASALLTEVPIWTLDKKLDEVSTELGIGFNKKQGQA